MRYTTSGVRPLALLMFVFGSFLLSACSGGSHGITTGTPSLPLSSTATPPASIAHLSQRSTAAIATSSNRPGFLGAMFRPTGTVPAGVFTTTSSFVAPRPYPTPGSVMTGSSGYCEQVAANGASLDGSFAVDATKLTNAIYLGARWTRMPVPQFSVDNSHIFGPGQYAWGMIDAAQCQSLVYHNLKPVLGIEPGPVQYDSTPGTFSPTSVPSYQSAADFGQWCGAVATHEAQVFPQVTQYSIPASEANDPNPTMFPGGNAQIASYTKACYAAIKAANPNSFIYGFELNMDGQAGATQFVKDMYALGCKVGTCYDGIIMHLSLRYPIPTAGTPCYPNPGGDYSMQCITDIQNAAQSPAMHVLISETVYLVTSTVPDEQTKADAAVQALTTFAANPTVDGVSYANIDECGAYTGYFAGGCLIDTSGNQLPAYGALQWLAIQHFL
jgi:hypothetical protein